MSLFVNDQKVGEGRIEQTQGITLGLGGTLDVGEDTGSARRRSVHAAVPVRRHDQAGDGRPETKLILSLMACRDRLRRADGLTGLCVVHCLAADENAMKAQTPAHEPDR